jgi:hypothetical protein
MKKSTFKINFLLTILLWSFMPVMAQSDYGSDIIIKNTPTQNQRNPSLAIAGNGWLYATFITNIGSTSGLEVMKSTDNGQNWSSFYTYSSTIYICDVCKVIACGTAPYKVLLGIIYHTVSTNYYSITVTEFDGITNAQVAQRFLYNATTTSPIVDFDLVADDMFPSNGTSPYGVGLLYSRRSTTDSIKFVYSTNGGNNFGTSKTIATSVSFFGKVSLAYGYSPNFDFGRYNAVWEEKPSNIARTGRIVYSRTSSGITGDFITPVYVDWEGNTIGKCYNPKIACQFSNTDNDSTNVTAVIVMERYYNNLDNDIIGYYNNKGSSGNTWNRFNIDNSNINTKQPDVNFDSYYGNFLVSYWDSTNTYLPYVIHNLNFSPTSSTWGIVSTNYNSNTTMGNLIQPYPVVEIDNTLHKVAHLWSCEGSGGNGIVIFDAEYTDGFNEFITFGNDKINNLYPNPAFGATNLEIEMNKPALVQINVYDMAGKKISTIYNAQTKEGKTTISFDVSNFVNGNYIIEMTTAASRLTTKMMVAHQ